VLDIAVSGQSTKGDSGSNGPGRPKGDSGRRAALAECCVVARCWGPHGWKGEGRRWVVGSAGAPGVLPRVVYESIRGLTQCLSGTVRNSA
jgi:hypothetical protein